VPVGEDPFADEQRPRQPQGAAPNFARFPWDVAEPKAEPSLEQQIHSLRMLADQGFDLTNDPAVAEIQSSDSAAAAGDAPPFQFEHFNLMNNESFTTVVEEADAATLELALTGADARIIRRVLRLLPVREAARWRQRLERPSPLRLRDIELAREALARLAVRLARQNRIALPTRRGFAAAA
jgi:hypothetical protein